MQLSSLSFAVAFGEEFPTTIQGMLDAHVVSFILPDWRDTRAPEEWADLVLQSRPTLVDSETADLQEQFVNILADSPLYGTHWFYVLKVNNTPSVVAKLPNELLLGFNSDGMHAFTTNKSFLASFPYADIYRWGGSASQFSLVIWDATGNLIAYAKNIFNSRTYLMKVFEH